MDIGFYVGIISRLHYSLCNVGSMALLLRPWRRALWTAVRASDDVDGGPMRRFCKRCTIDYHIHDLLLISKPCTEFIG